MSLFGKRTTDKQICALPVHAGHLSGSVCDGGHPLESRPMLNEKPRYSAERSTERRPWVPPAVTELPKLTDLTLQSDDPIGGGGGTGGGGSTVF